MAYLISLDNLGRRVIGTKTQVSFLMKEASEVNLLVVSLIVLIPFVTSMHAVEISWFARPVLIFPVI